MKEQVGEYKTRRTDGRIVRVLEYRDRHEIIVGRGGEKGTTLSKLSSFQTEDGQAVNRIDAETFRIVETGEILRLLDS